MCIPAHGVQTHYQPAFRVVMRKITEEPVISFFHFDYDHGFISSPQRINN